MDNRVRLKWKLGTVSSFKADGSLPLLSTILPAFKSQTARLTDKIKLKLQDQILNNL